MSPVFTVIVVILAILAIVDLIVGVSNDAINFLNSSLGSKIASYKTIISVAAVGILVGVLTSHGMMEVARNGVFHPEMFTFSEIMFLYVGVMLTDVILLDGFNKLGLPTSTTVSMIFELLGASMAVTVFKIYGGDLDAGIGEFVNGGKALGMISAILVSVVLSFIVGSVVMYFSRIRCSVVRCRHCWHYLLRHVQGFEEFWTDYRRDFRIYFRQLAHGARRRVACFFAPVLHSPETWCEHSEDYHP